MTRTNRVNLTTRSPELEAVEPRRLLSAAINGHGVLYIQGTGGNDTITVFLKKGDPGTIVARVNKQFTEFARSDVTRSIALIGGDGNDRLAAWDDNGAIGLRVSMAGGNGRDILHGHGADDVMDGGNGNDALFGEAGDDSLFGGNGHDVVHGGNGNDVCLGGMGRDRLFGDDGQDDCDGGKDDDSISGGAGNDDFSRNDHADEIHDHRADDDGDNHGRHGFGDDHPEREFEPGDDHGGDRPDGVSDDPLPHM